MATASLDIARPDPHAPPAAAAEPAPPSLAGLTRAELTARLADIGVPERERKMRAAQLWHWIYFRGARRFEDMSNVGKGLRAALAEAYTLARPEVVSEQVSKDGTRKWLIRMRRRARATAAPRSRPSTSPRRPRRALRLQPGRLHAELHLLPHRHPGAGPQPDRRGDRGAGAGRPRRARRMAGPGAPWGARAKGLLPTDGERFVSNIVFMGMGEPLYNLDNVADADRHHRRQRRLSLSRRRITVSTSGVVPEMRRARRARARRCWRSRCTR